jgi:hypothetical protein
MGVRDTTGTGVLRDGIPGARNAAISTIRLADFEYGPRELFASSGALGAGDFYNRHLLLVRGHSASVSGRLDSLVD